jgi:hypothetical protein
MSILKSLRELVSLESIGNGQGFIKCDCKIGKCVNCKCKKANIKCNSRCHRRMANSNCKNFVS